MSSNQKIPLWVQVFAFFACILATTVGFRYAWLKAKACQVDDQHLMEKAIKRAKAAELARQGFEMLRQQKRNQLWARCREDGNYPLLFIDKIVCVKPESIAWVKYDDNPEQDTSQGGAQGQ